MSRRRVEWPTLAVAAGCYALWGLAVFWLPGVSLLAAVAAAAVAIALFSSLQHEVIHGHPFRAAPLNAALVWPSLTLVVPFARFRDTHLAHHQDSVLTDPFDDPESQYLDAGTWARLPRAVQAVLRVNNTLAGRVTIGPALGQVAFMADDLRRIAGGAPGVLRAWLWHLPAAAVVLAAVASAPMPLWAYGLAVYGGLAILRIRTYLEHQAHLRSAARSVVIEDRGPLAFLFLNNNFHIVHHMHPTVPWYRLPALYAAQPERYLTRNEGYRYASYGEVFRRYFWRAKEPVAHPLWRRG